MQGGDSHFSSLELVKALAWRLVVFLLLFVMLFYHFDNDSKCDDKWNIDPWSNVYAIAITENRELATNVCKDVSIVVAYGEVPMP